MEINNPEGLAQLEGILNDIQNPAYRDGISHAPGNYLNILPVLDQLVNVKANASDTNHLARRYEPARDVAISKFIIDFILKEEGAIKAALSAYKAGSPFQ
jgi:hypothetical protein